MNEKLLGKLRAMPESSLYLALYQDERTQLLNRRALMELRLDEEGAPVFDYVALVDLDSLKYINDHKGHIAGDVHLLALSRIFLAMFGPHRTFHLYGDEFLIGGNRADTLQRDLETCRSQHPGFSFGVGNWIAQADLAMRKDKAARQASGQRAARGERPWWLKM